MAHLEMSVWGKEALTAMADRIDAREIDPYSAVEELVAKML
jgi:hypothetical protein